MSAQLIKNGTDIFTLVVETRGDGIVQRRVLIVLALVVAAHSWKEYLNEFLCFIVHVGSLVVEGVG